MILLDIFEQREAYQQAIDALEQRYIDGIREKIGYLEQSLAQARTAEEKQAIKKRIKEYQQEIIKHTSVKETQQPTQRASQQDAFAYVKPEPKGIGDIQDPKQKMAQLTQKAKKGPLANIGAGIKAFVKGEPEPLDEQELGRRGIGMANMKSLQATVEQGLARTIFQFPNMKYVVGEDDTDKMADYYNGQDAAGRTNFVYNVLGDATKFIQMCKQLGIAADPVEPQQPELPGITPQGQLPLSEKKKSDSDDLDAGDVKTARELQKLRALYPAAKSDVEAVARAEIDSTERSQQQLSAIRGANEKQDALLKQLVALDREQGREIDNLDKENDSLEKQLDQVQTTNARLAQTIGQMTGTKKPTRAVQKPAQQPTKTQIDLIPGAPADQQKVVPMSRPQVQAEPAPEPAEQPAVEPVRKDNVVQLRRPDFPERLVKAKKVSGSDIREHGGGIGPRQHWQSLMKNENITREPRNSKERDDMIDKIRRMMSQERNPANLQIMKKDIEMLKHKYRDIKEDNASAPAERAILNRIMVAHTDLLKQYGPQKVMQAAEEVAYNVGDVAEIGTSDVSGWVQQVKQILGAQP